MERWIVRAAALLVLLILGTHYARNRDHRLDELDEAAVVYSTPYLDLVLAGRFDDPAWKAIDAIDHPPAWKYFHGAALKLAGRPPRTLAEKDLWLDWAWRGEAAHEEFKRYTRNDVPLEDLLPGRTLSALAIIGAVLLLLWCGVRASSPVTGSLAAVLLAVHATVKWVSTEALIDGLLLFGIMGSTALTIRWLEQDPRRVRAALPWSLALGVSLGVLSQLKITGGVGGLAAALALVGYLVHARADRQQALAALTSLALVALTAVAVAVGINPSLWTDPLGFLSQMVEHRALQLRLQMLFSNRDGMVSVVEGIRRFVSRSMLWTDPFYRAAWVPAVAFGIVLGTLRLWRAESRSPARIAALTQLGVWGLVTLATYRMDWPRYLLPVLPLFTLLTAEALAYLGSVRGRVPPRLLALSVAGALALVGVAHLPTQPTGEDRKARLEASVQFLDEELARTSSTSHKAIALRVRRNLFERRLADPTSDPIR